MVSPVTIDPVAVFDDGSVYMTLGISATALARARREGRLRYTRQGNRVLYLGEWVTEWLRTSAQPEAAHA